MHQTLLNNLGDAAISLVIACLAFSTAWLQAKTKRLAKQKISLKSHAANLQEHLEKARTDNETVSEIKEQVTNSHGTNLRADLDRVLVGIARLDRRLDRFETAQDEVNRQAIASFGRMFESTENIRRSATQEHERIWHAVDKIQTEQAPHPPPRNKFLVELLWH
ncbi:DUF2746 domain-containing protein [Varibaculum prostatecancerukia]|uniref:DUF2746 domain-containing protein n=1 Tax=Varibaculum prostatecancerukia TaxID=2811781 RepID=UPI001BFFDD6E|nr:DUF2746 domain-containing protein [Varibaculum prostatecancerukia]